MPAMVIDCILLVPNSQAILNIFEVKDMPDIIFPIYMILYSDSTVSFR